MLSWKIHNVTQSPEEHVLRNHSAFMYKTHGDERGRPLGEQVQRPVHGERRSKASRRRHGRETDQVGA